MKKRTFFAIFLLLFVVLSACSAPQKEVSSDKSSDISVMINVTKNNGKEEVKTKKVKAKSGSTLYQMMKANFEIKDDDGFITSIEGVSQNQAKNLYWMYEINGKYATKGAKETKPKNGDKVSFDLHEAK
ncbi:hypothetical protein MFLO_13218 [Listeria floridensis FSL S10-1187]|uniref:Transcobalamin-like C-terminal domain-containing protein n=1 Tax=Listeria floridensis FSL S10-1187 TaxID=1265817 RepID=A0ABN0RCQ4_9LIST|nr:DUF4430 domain-containing protein [Listeria floridensis]EUJ27425.1 hypothetical protein MFLO_13218 [Listeria floridensis FSL S10-1187]